MDNWFWYLTPGFLAGGFFYALLTLSQQRLLHCHVCCQGRCVIGKRIPLHKAPGQPTDTGKMLQRIKKCILTL